LEYSKLKYEATSYFAYYDSGFIKKETLIIVYASLEES